MVNAMGPYNLRREPIEEKIARIDDIGGPDTHSNFPLGWAMAANTPLRRYKQNTHGGGIRDPLVISWPQGHRRARRAAPPVLPRQRPRADPARDRRRQAARDDQRRRRRCRSRARASPPASAMPRRRRRPSRNISRCSAIAAWCRTAGRPWLPSAGRRLRAGQVGALPSRPRLQRDRRSRRAASPSG